MFEKCLTIVLLLGLVFSFGMGALAKTTVVYWTSAVPADTLDIELPKEFTKENPDIKVVREFIPAAIKDKVMLAIASGNTPDVVATYIGSVSSWWYVGALVPLNDTLSKDDLEDLIPEILEYNTIDGNLFAYPRYYVIRRWGVNRTLAKAAGVDNLLPQGDDRSFSFDNFMTMVEAIGELPGKYPLGFSAHLLSGYTLMNFQMFGANLYEDKDYTKTTLNTDAGVRALEWMMEMVEKGYAAPGAAGLKWEVLQGSIQGKIAFGYLPDTALSRLTFEKGESDELGEPYILELPVVEGAPGAPMLVTGESIAVFKGPEQEAAIKFVQFMTNRKNTLRQQIQHKGEWLIYPRKSAASQEPQVRLLEIMAAKYGIDDTGLTSRYGGEANDLLYAELQAAWMGKKTPREALNDFADLVLELWK